MEESGATSVALWRSALRLLGFVRRIMANHEALTHSSSRVKRFSFADQSCHEVAPVATPRRASNYASKLMASSTYDPTPVPRANGTPTRTAETLVLRQGQSRGQSENAIGVTAPTATLSACKDAIAVQDDDAQMIGQLPKQAWEKIFYFLTDPAGILSERQRRAVIAWGSNRDTLASEAEILGKPASVQIWRVLEGMDCLTYDDISN